MLKTRNLFEEKILKIDGVKGYLFIRDDGRIIAGEAGCDRPETLASMIVITQMNCNSISSVMGFTHFNFLMFTDKNNDKLFVFPVKKYFLGILYGKEEYDAAFISKVHRFIHKITSKNKHI